MPIHIRSRKISDNRLSLYADTGAKENRFRSLNIYLYPGKDKVTKQINKEALIIARQKVAKLERELSLPDIYTPQEINGLKQQEKGKVGVLSFILSNARNKEESNYYVWNSTAKQLQACWGGAEKKFSDLTLLDVDNFREYLLHRAISERTKKRISHNSAVCYFATFKSILTDAYRGGYLLSDMSVSAKSIPAKETIIEHFTAEEIKVLKHTDCKCRQTKIMSLFSTATGMRWSDVCKLKPEDIETRNGETFIRMFHKKTKSWQMLPVSESTLNLLPDTPPGEKIFTVDYDSMRKHLKKWLSDAGIKRHLTFHAFRHTNAMLLLENGVDILTISSMLGHANVKTTQVYAKPLESRRRAAANAISI